MGLRGRKTYDNLDNTYFITTTVLGFRKVFAVHNSYCDILIHSLNFTRKKYSSYIIAYVLMPNHVHLILKMNESNSVSDYMRDFKRHTSTEVIKLLKKDKKVKLLDDLYNLGGTGNYRLWKDRFDDLIIVTEKTLKIKIDYIHNNPVKAGLVENITDWNYSSARNYYLDDDSLFRVDRII